ncbi:lysozyme g-like isoform X3 [Chaetodon auriga]|uniref:lysozyme g-like isoform X3 n=1 Tax=Chaetodon auriga TaxID=39042 RepID=UPI004033136A
MGAVFTYFSTSSQSDSSDSSTSSQSDCSGYGNIMKVQTSGASWDTAQQDGPGSVSKEDWNESHGLEASHTMAKTDADRMRKYRRKIDKVGSEHGIDPSLIAAIISRESRAGNTLHNGWGDYDPVRKEYNAWGLMQVDVNPNGGDHTPEGEWDSKKHLRQATKILVDFIKNIQGKKSFSGLSKEQQLKGGIAAYNTGDGNVHTYERVDENTTGKDYSNDVVARAQWYKEHRSRWDCLQ